MAFKRHYPRGTTCRPLLFVIYVCESDTFTAPRTRASLNSQRPDDSTPYLRGETRHLLLFLNTFCFLYFSFGHAHCSVDMQIVVLVDFVKQLLYSCQAGY